jgi:Spy/CpxP family protein refolding chaperone
MYSPDRSKWKLRAAAVLIFLLGCAAGALAPAAYRGWARAGAGGAREQHRRDRFEQMLERLELDDARRPQVRQILGETREQMRALRRESEPREQQIRRQTDERLQQVLTPEQWQKFQAEMHQRRGRGGRGGGPPPDREP